jgi:ribonucleoside-diphosphate reductase beta chain
MKSLDWDENEFLYESCNAEFKTCPKNVSEMMIRTLAWQWEMDSVASRSIAPILAPFITSSELWAAWQRVSDNEVIHAATYSEIVRGSFGANANEILGEVLKVTESFRRMSAVTKIMADTYRVSHLYALGMVDNCQEVYNQVYMFVVALWAMERIQFMSSFAITFAVATEGWFIPVGKAVQKIAQDELEVHSQLDMIVLEYEHQTERGKVAREQCREQVQVVIDEVIECEVRWINDGLFSEGRELIGMNAQLCTDWTLFMAKPVYDFFGMKAKYPFPEKNPLVFMEDWLNIGKTQPSPQEESVGQYKMGVMRRDDEDAQFDVDF